MRPVLGAGVRQPRTLRMVRDRGLLVKRAVGGHRRRQPVGDRARPVHGPRPAARGARSVPCTSTGAVSDAMVAQLVAVVLGAMGERGLTGSHLVLNTSQRQPQTPVPPWTQEGKPNR
jgi:hypothetical protein